MFLHALQRLHTKWVTPEVSYKVPWDYSFSLPEVLPLLSETGAVWALNPDPCTDSSLDFQYTVEIVAVHLSLRSPCKKCLCRTWKERFCPFTHWNAKSTEQKTRQKLRGWEIFTLIWISKEFLLQEVSTNFSFYYVKNLTNFIFKYLGSILRTSCVI